MIQLPLKNDQDLVVFTDLDGTLIDHHAYSVQGSQIAVDKLVERGVPLVFCSSKTFAEQVHLQNELHISQPFIFENGSAIAIPTGFFPKNGYGATRREGGYDIVVLAHADAATLLLTLMPFKEICGYADASDVELSSATGLLGDALQRARARWFTETVLSSKEVVEAANLQSVLQVAGFTLSRGGRFFTVQSALVDKGKAVRWLMELFRQTSPQAPLFAAVGDSPNDVPMLEVVDLPFLVQGPKGSWVPVDLPRLKKIPAVGPAGFSAAINRVLGE